MRRLAIPFVVLGLALTAVALWLRDPETPGLPLQRVPASIVQALTSKLPPPTDETFPVLVVREEGGAWVPAVDAEVWLEFSGSSRVYYGPDEALGENAPPNAIADAQGIVHVPRWHSAVTILGRVGELERREHWSLVTGKPEVSPVLALRPAPRLTVRTVDANGDAVPHVGLYWSYHDPNGEMTRGPRTTTDAGGSFVVQRCDKIVDIDWLAGGGHLACRCPLAVRREQGDRPIRMPDWGESAEILFEVVEQGFVDWSPPVPEGCVWPTLPTSVECRTKTSSLTLATEAPKTFPWRIAVPLGAEISIRVGEFDEQYESVAGPTRSGEIVSTSVLPDHFWIRGRVDTAALGWTRGGWAAKYGKRPIRVADDGTFSMPFSRAEWVALEQWRLMTRGRPQPYPRMRIEFETDHRNLVALDLPIPEDPPDIIDVGSVEPVELVPTVQGSVTLDGRPAPADLVLWLEARDAEGEWRSLTTNRSIQRGRVAFYCLDPGDPLRVVVDDDRVEPIGPVPVPVGTRTVDLRLELAGGDR